jgi:LuxR family transcriptional regulator, maltose regulon positive regulatory protein
VQDRRDEDYSDRHRYARTKFAVPAPPERLVHRARLYARLDSALAYRLTLICAPAGFGKTTLVTSWLRTHPANHPTVVWLSLNGSDNGVVPFLDALAHALFTVIGAGGEAIRLLNTPHRVITEHIVTALANEIADSTRLLLIFDDFHNITESAVHHALMFLIEALPPTVSVFLISRSVPLLPSARLRAAGQLIEIDSRQLGCNRDEAHAFFANVAGKQLPADVLDDVLTYTQGWFIALQLLGVMLHSVDDPVVLLPNFQRGNRTMIDYLTEEVLHAQPDAVRTFMQRTSVLDELSAPLCDYVLDTVGSRQVLELLERQNLFVMPLDSLREQFRYHPIIAETLRQQLQRDDSSTYTLLLDRASVWYEQADRLAAATEYAVRAGNWERAADLLERLIASADDPRRSDPDHRLVVISRLVQQIPQRTIESRLGLCLFCVRTFWLGVPFATVQAWLTAADRLLRSQPMLDAAPTLGEVMAWQALIVAIYRYDLDTSARLKAQAEQIAPQMSPRARSLLRSADVQSDIARGYLRRAAYQCENAAVSFRREKSTSDEYTVLMGLMGRYLSIGGYLNEAWDVLNELLISNAEEYAVLTSVRIYMADVLRERHALKEAFALIEEALQSARQTDGVVFLDQAYRALVRLHLSNGNIAGANAALERTREHDALLESGYRVAEVVGDRSRVWLAHGNIPRVERMLGQLRQWEPYQSSAFLRIRVDLATVRLLLAQNNGEEALALVDDILARLQLPEQPLEMHGDTLDALLLKTLSHGMLQQTERAKSTLVQAIASAEPEGYVQRFLDEGQAIYELLRTIDDHRSVTIHRLIRAFENAGQSSSDIFTMQTLDPLTKRELEILRCIANGASNQQIGQALSLSLNTVKRYVSNVYRKLDVQNRTSAVARARQLRLID